MARRSIPQETKNAVLEGLRNGVKVSELAAQYNLSVPTVYNYRKSLLVTTTEETNA